MKSRTIAFVLLLILSSSFVAADTYSLADPTRLPLSRLNSPVSHENEMITKYSYEEIDYYLWNSPNFIRWNDGKKVCESMQIMFGKQSERCALLPTRVPYVPEKDVYVAPTYVKTSSATATATFTIEPYTTTKYVEPTRRHTVIRVDPIYPPYGFMYRPYARY